MSIAVGLAREAMKGSSTPESAPAARPPDLGTALAQQFALIDRNTDAMVKMVNAQSQELKAALKRQRIWNIALAVGLIAALAVAILK